MATLSSAVTIKRRESRIFNYVAITVANIEIYISMVANTVYARKCDYISMVHAHSLAAPCLAFGNSGAIGLYQKLCKIGGKLVLITNRMSYMSFRLVPKSVTFNDLERRNGPYFALFYGIW